MFPELVKDFFLSILSVKIVAQKAYNKILYINQSSYFENECVTKVANPIGVVTGEEEQLGFSTCYALS